MIFADYYLPGYKSGGGMRTIVNMVERLGGRYDFRIVTRDHDGKLDRKQYENVHINAWNEVGRAQVYYLSKDRVRISKLRELILETRPDAIYLNSFFATLAIYVLKLRRLRLIPWTGIVLAPCGELSEGALRLKNRKKRFFMNTAKLIGLYRDLVWKPSTRLEREEIERFGPLGARYVEAADMPPRTIYPEYEPDRKPQKEKGSARLVFLSRFMRKKNFKWLLEILREERGRLEIDVYGPLEDSEYWEECSEIIEGLPPNISVRAKGPVPHSEVPETLFGYHFFIMPTLGENFGHIFLEALAAGCPLIISDRTPWRDLPEKRIGWDLPLEEPLRWRRVISEAVRMENGEYRRLSRAARHYLEEWLASESHEKDTVEALETALKLP